MFLYLVMLSRTDRQLQTDTSSLARNVHVLLHREMFQINPADRCEV